MSNQSTTSARTTATLLSPDQVAEAAARIDAAERGHGQIRQLSLQYPGMTIEDAYSVQRSWVAMKLARGRSVRGHKVGLTSRAMQRSSNITEPDYGAVLDDMFFEEGGDVPISRFIVPRVEVELAFVLKAPLRGPKCTLFDVLNATDYVTPAIEIIDARIQQIDPDTKKTRKVVDTIADNAANAGVLLGGRPVRPDAIDLRWVGAILSRNGMVEETGVAAGVLNHPAKGPAWLANRLYKYDVALEPGQIILGGSFTSPVTGVAGDVFCADYGPLGAITFRFA